VDFNVAMTRSGQYVEVQGSAEGGTFSPDDLDRMLQAARRAIRRIIGIQEAALARKPRR